MAALAGVNGGIMVESVEDTRVVSKFRCEIDGEWVELVFVVFKEEVNTVGNG